MNIFFQSFIHHDDDGMTEFNLNSIKKLLDTVYAFSNAQVQLFQVDTCANGKFDTCTYIDDRVKIKKKKLKKSVMCIGTYV